MDNKVKILLGSEDIISRRNEDIFLNVELVRTYKEASTPIYYNNFDLNKQFREERNSSRNFFIYGTVTSLVEHCDNRSLYLYSEDPNENPNSLFAVVYTQPISATFQNLNIGTKRTGKYAFKLNNYELSNNIFIKTYDYGRVGEENFKKQLVYTADTYNYTGGTTTSVVEYGTEDVEVTTSGKIETIDNQFPFFYNKHWIKFNLEFSKKRAWRALESSYFCVLDNFVNNGLMGWYSLEEYYVENGEPTGVVKLNTPGELDYIVPTINNTFCPIGGGN